MYILGYRQHSFTKAQSPGAKGIDPIWSQVWSSVTFLEVESCGRDNKHENNYRGLFVLCYLKTCMHG